MILIESGILIYAKILHHSFIPTICENFIPIFWTYLLQTKICKLAYLFHLSNWKNKSSFEILSLDNILINGHYLENVIYHVRWKLLHLGPDLKICWFAVAEVCCFEYTRSVLKRKYFFSFFEKDSINPYPWKLTPTALSPPFVTVDGML